MSLSRFRAPLVSCGLLLVLSIVVIGCGDDDSGPAVDAGADTGTDSAMPDTGTDSATPDTGTDGGPGVSIIVSPTAGLRTTEMGGTDVFTVALSDEPTADVTIALVSGDPTEGTLDPQVITFTADNWNAPQSVTVTGVDDEEADGDQTFTVSTVPAGSTDPRYAGEVGPAVMITNTDDETAGVTVSAISGQVAESGTTATFTAVLNSAPTADVTIGLSSSDATEGSVTPSEVTFTVDNWSAPQLVTVTGVDDSEADGVIAFSIATAAAISSDTEYADLDADDVAVENVDDETAGAVVSAISGTTGEDGASATFSVTLTSAPSADVVISVSSNDTTEGTLSLTELTFTSVNWNAAQEVTVTGADDDLADGNQPYSIVLGAAVSGDTGYNGYDPSDVAVTNLDNDSPDVTVSVVTGPTTEAGGSATFTIALRTQPTADVTFALSVSDDTEGELDVSSVTFTSDNWNAPQTVTVTGIDDDIADGNQVYSVVIAAATSSDDGYNGLNPSDVSVTNNDNETPGVTVSPVSGDVSESAQSATFTVVLDSQPVADVTIDLSSDDTGEGTVSPATLTFTSLNWNAPQLVTVTGVNDDLDDGTQSFQILTAASISSDPLYSGINPVDVSVSNVDNDTAGITVSDIAGPTSEAGGSSTFTIVLNSRPSDDVVIALSSSNTAEGTVLPGSVTFTVDNWSSARTVTVTGVNDGNTDGDQIYTIVTAVAVSSDSAYNGIDPADVSVTNIDNETPGIVVSGVSRTTTEAGISATLTIVLNSQPTADVTIGVSSSDLTEGTVSPASVTFNAGNWNIPQTVTVTGVDDFIADGNQVYRVDTAPAVSADPDYNGINPPNRSVTNRDNETAGITVSSASTDTNEGGGTATFTVVLNSQPLNDVTIGLSSSDLTEGTINLSSVTFSAGNWNVAQTVTVTGVDDFLADGGQSFIVVTAPAVSTDPSYSGMNAGDVTVLNLDNDSPGFVISPISGDTSEDGDTATFTIRLLAQPAANVRIVVQSSDTTEGTVSLASITFSPSNWNTDRTVTVTGVNDILADGSQVYSIVLAPAASTDPAYSGLNPADVSVTNQDNDQVVIIVSGISQATTESGGTATFLIALTSQPDAAVTIGISSSNEAEGTVSVPQVTFTPGNWNTPKVVTVTGVDDNAVDGDVAYSIVTAPAMSTDPLYNNVNPANVAVTNTDND